MKTVSKVVYIETSRLRKSRYNPRMVHDPDRHRILVESIRRNGVMEPLLVYQVDDGYEVLDGSRRLAAAVEAGLDTVPCIVVQGEEAPRISLAIHFSQDDLTESELVLYVERLVAEEVFQSVEEVCRFLGVSKSWFYTLRRAARLGPLDSGAPATTLAMVEKTRVEPEKKRRIVEALDNYPLPRPMLREALREIEEKPMEEPEHVLERFYWASPRRSGEDAVTASGVYEYVLRRLGGVVEFLARNGVETLWRVEIPAQDLMVVRLLWQRL